MSLNLEPYRQTVEELKPYFEHWENILREFLQAWVSGGHPEVKIMVFGSILSGKAHPAVSDIDVLVIVPQETDLQTLRRKWLSEFRRKHPFHPFEFHFVDSRLFKEWYSRFVDKTREIRI